jgi:hypothetical protein
MQHRSKSNARFIDILNGFLIVIAMFAFYLAPFIVAKVRGMAYRWSILTLNLFLGWTLIGWVISLCWSVAGTAEIKSA